MNKRQRRQKKLTASPISVSIDRLSHEGRGITEIDGKTTFIFGALPGETVLFRYTKCRSQYDEGEAIEVINAAKDRVTPACPHFGVCGGCSLQHMSHDLQIQHKQSTVLDLLKNTPPKHVLPPITAEVFGYRRKARIGVKFVPKKGKVLVGFREKNAPYIADLSICHTLHPDIGQSIAALSDLFGYMDAKNTIPQLEIAVGDDATAIIVRHLTPLSDRDCETLINFCREKKWHLYLQPGNTDSVHRIYPTSSEETLRYYLPEYSLTFEFHPTQFTQINHEINQKMVHQAIELLDLQSTDCVLDLFCGIGNFSLPIAKKVSRVVGVEGDQKAVDQACANANNNQLINTQFFCANLFEDLNHNIWGKSIFNKIVLDPPRSGAKEIAENIHLWHPSHIVYISCNPATLARDAEILSKAGYYLEKAGIMDMFPQTQHVESIALFKNEHATKQGPAVAGKGERSIE